VLTSGVHGSNAVILRRHRHLRLWLECNDPHFQVAIAGRQYPIGSLGSQLS
jgi:hypothetical protein